MRFALRDERGAALGFPGVTATVHLLPALGVLGVGPAPDWLPSSDPFLRQPVLVLRMRLRDGPAVGGGKRFAAAEPMSALRRSGYGPSDGPSSYGRYYGPGGGDVPVHVPPPLYPPLRPEPPQPPVSWRGRGGAPAETTWPGEGAGGDAYYPSGGAWAEPSRAGGGHQSLNSYTNGAYGPPYPPGPGPNTASYSGAYYVPGYTQSNYSTEVPSTYRSPGNSPTPVSRWIYSQQDCQTEAPPLRGQVPGYPASQNPAMTLPHYPYGDGNRTVPQSGSTVRPQDDAWASGAYGMGARYPWPSAAPSVAPGNLYMSESASAWPGNSSPQPPPSPPPQQPKDSSYSYNQSGQGLSRHGFPCSVHQYESSGATNNENSDLLDSQVQYSAEPQLYGNATSDHPSNPVQSNNLPEECFTSDEGTPPSIKKIIHVLEKVQYLEQEVEEFVGKKTDKAYWLLEEMLTKELLELDSIETGGQDSVRQARKEAVCKIQAILEKLEKKGL
ncbi:BAG family molecular chaperone regulator 4 isoform X2 [Peromyscus californicus insignis]|uniref:BAG family molecular chaperone regulator 4 isoform X2 n=1 Tax=Peromyscus californicus insignis TaxID=564181 RepID=UPI0022A7FBE0|nr:BAG family molecular chaperone regulator 4 isoform X2 [Peromyscus californicus insignis]